MVWIKSDENERLMRTLLGTSHRRLRQRWQIQSLQCESIDFTAFEGHERNLLSAAGCDDGSSCES
jgi:hypothetical protein